MAQGDYDFEIPTYDDNAWGAQAGSTPGYTPVAPSPFSPQPTFAGAGHRTAYQQPQPQQHGQQYYQYPPQPSVPQPQPQYFNPQPPIQQPQQASSDILNNMGIDPTMANIGVRGAMSLIDTMEVKTFARRWFSSLRYNFNVNTSYVAKKLRIVLFPFLHKSWFRRVDQAGSFYPPLEDVNAPDLYIPLMAFVTYILIVGFFMGTKLQFTPDMLGMTASTALFTLLFEVCCLKALLYIFNLTAVSFLDLSAYCGYAFVSVDLNILIGLAMGSLGFYGAYFVNSTLLAIFMIRTFRAVIPNRLSGTNMLRGYFLMLIAGLQYLVAFFLCFLDYQSSGISWLQYMIPSFYSSTVPPADNTAKLEVE